MGFDCEDVIFCVSGFLDGPGDGCVACPDVAGGHFFDLVFHGFPFLVLVSSVPALLADPPERVST